MKRRKEIDNHSTHKIIETEKIIIILQIIQDFLIFFIRKIAFCICMRKFRFISSIAFLLLFLLLFPALKPVKVFVMTLKS